MTTKIYRNDNDKAYDIPGLGEIGAGERVTFQGEFPPAINLVNFPGLVDVLAEEELGKNRDYEDEPEVVTHRFADDLETQSEDKTDE